MSIKIASLLVPAYIKPVHEGQTPEVYASRVTEKWETELVARVNGVVKHKPTERLAANPLKGGIARMVVVRYDFEVDTTEPALAEVIALALSTFGVKLLTVYLSDTQAEEFDAEAAEELSIGAHDWSDVQ